MSSTSTPAKATVVMRATIWGCGLKFSCGCRPVGPGPGSAVNLRSEEHTSELQSLMRISYAVFCLKKKKLETKNQRAKRSTRNEKTTKTQNCEQERNQRT